MCFFSAGLKRSRADNDSPAPSLGTSLVRSSTVAEPSPPRPTPFPHLLSCGAVLGRPGPPNRLLHDPCPMAGWQAQLVTVTVAPTEGPIKISPPYHGGPSARHSLLMNSGKSWHALTRGPCLAGVAHRGGVRRALMCDRFGLEVGALMRAMSRRYLCLPSLHTLDP